MSHKWTGRPNSCFSLSDAKKKADEHKVGHHDKGKDDAAHKKKSDFDAKKKGDEHHEKK